MTETPEPINRVRIFRIEDHVMIELDRGPDGKTGKYWGKTVSLKSPRGHNAFGDLIEVDPNDLLAALTRLFGEADKHEGMAPYASHVEPRYAAQDEDK